MVSSNKESAFNFAAYSFSTGNHFGLCVLKNYYFLPGDSAGGALAAAIMNKLIDKNVQPRPMTQILIYPTLQGLNFRTPSYREFNGNPYRGFVTSDMMVYFWITYALGKCDNNSLYLQNAHISDNLKNSKYFSYMDEQHLPEKYLLNKDLEPKQFRPELADKVNKILVDPYFSPLFAEDDVLRRMPQTYIMTCDFDPLRDEGYYYANRLRQLDVPVTHKHYEGYDHGILVVEFYSGAKVAQKDVMGFISNIV